MAKRDEKGAAVHNIEHSRNWGEMVSGPRTQIERLAQWNAWRWKSESAHRPIRNTAATCYATTVAVECPDDEFLMNRRSAVIVIVPSSLVCVVFLAPDKEVVRRADQWQPREPGPSLLDGNRAKASFQVRQMVGREVHVVAAEPERQQRAAHPAVPRAARLGI